MLWRKKEHINSVLKKTEGRKKMCENLKEIKKEDFFRTVDLHIHTDHSDGKNTQLISLHPMSVKISANGLFLKAVPTAF